MPIFSHTFTDVLAQKLSGPNGLALLLLFLSAVLSATALYARSVGQRSLRGFFRYAFPTEIIFHRSARADMLFWITRKAVMFVVMLPVTISSVATVGYLTHAAFARIPGLGERAPGPAGPVTICVFTLTMLLVYDLSYYLYHRMQHRFPILWELHKVHHSAEVLVGITKDRVHPLDEVMGRLWDGLLPGMAYGLWLFIALDPVELTIFGINVYVMRSILMMDLLRHTQLKISFGKWINNVVLCPHYHQLHHSINPKHYDKNFGLMMSIWDRMFGTLAVPAPGETFAFGLAAREHDEYQSLFGLYVLPLQKIFRHLIPTARTPDASSRAEPRGA